MQELIKKVESVLRAKFPNYSKEELEEMISEYGQIALLETYDKVLKLLDTEEKKYKFGDLISDLKQEEAFQFAESEGVDITSIFEEVSKSVVVDLFS